MKEIETAFTDFSPNVDSGAICSQTRVSIVCAQEFSNKHGASLRRRIRSFGEGWVMSYGIDPVDVMRQVSYVDRILKGEPADLPYNSRPNLSWLSISKRQETGSSVDAANPRRRVMAGSSHVGNGT